MLSFTPESLEFMEADTEQDGVWVFYRLNYQSCLIIGVFDSRDSAFAYTGTNGPVDESGWVQPHPGQRHWQYDSDKFTYYLEQHQLRGEAGSVPEALSRSGTRG